MAKDTVFSTKKTLNLRGNLVSLAHPQVMGILNTTPDSFFAGSRKQSEAEVLERAEQIYKEGATIIDIGGYSSRPGATAVSTAEEIRRTVSHITHIRKELPELYISIDTFRSEVARAAVDAGADMVNDISGGTLDENMFATVTNLKIPYILMHMRGTPKTMVNETSYDNILLNMIAYFQQKISALRKGGLYDIIIDPGFGFAKTADQNYLLLKHLRSFQILGLPLLAGLSRKSMIYKPLGISPEESLNGTTVLNTLALTRGASILRVHDVKEAVEAVKLCSFMPNNHF